MTSTRFASGFAPLHCLANSKAFRKVGRCLLDQSNALQQALLVRFVSLVGPNTSPGQLLHGEDEKDVRALLTVTLATGRRSTGSVASVEAVVTAVLTCLKKSLRSSGSNSMGCRCSRSITLISEHKESEPLALATHVRAVVRWPDFSIISLLRTLARVAL
jgi:hypothetical protein